MYSSYVKMFLVVFVKQEALAAKYFEGDLDLGKKELKKIEEITDNPLLALRDAIADAAKRWPNGIVPYVMDDSLSSQTCQNERQDLEQFQEACKQSKEDGHCEENLEDPEFYTLLLKSCNKTCDFCGDFTKNKIRAAMDSFQSLTCLRFVPKTETHKNWIEFKWTEEWKSCTSDNVGMNPNGKNVIKFGGGCRCTPTIHHEIMHAIGFWHEQSRLDRDEHVTILWDNIAEGYADQFKKYPHGAADYLGANYDINSLLHYFGDAFGKGGNLTIVPKDRPNFKIPKPKRMSAIDVQQVRKLYKCDEDKKEEGS